MVEIFYNNLKDTDKRLEALANRLYNDSKYGDALLVYTMIKDKNACVLYNIGVCYIKAKDKEKALIYTEKALDKIIDDILDEKMDSFKYKILYNYIYICGVLKIEGKYNIYRLLEIAKNSHYSKNDSDFNSMYGLLMEI